MDRVLFQKNGVNFDYLLDFLCKTSRAALSAAKHNFFVLYFSVVERVDFVTGL